MVMVTVLIVVLATGLIVCPASLRRAVSGSSRWKILVLVGPLLLFPPPSLVLTSVQVLDLSIELILLVDVFTLEWTDGGEAEATSYRDSDSHKDCTMTRSIVSKVRRRHCNALCQEMTSCENRTRKVDEQTERT